MSAPIDISTVLPLAPTTGPQQDYHRELRLALTIALEDIRTRVEGFEADALSSAWMGL